MILYQGSAQDVSSLSKYNEHFLHMYDYYSKYRSVLYNLPALISSGIPPISVTLNK